MYLDLMLVRVAVHLTHSVPDRPTSTLDTRLKCLESSAYVHMLVSLCKKDLDLRLLLRPNSLLSFCHTSPTVLLFK